MSQANPAEPVEAARSPRSEKPGFRDDIEGLRAVAVLAVVLFHADVPGASGGYVGVDVFFVISGFLITRLLLREVSTVGTVRLRRFYGARARRLLPASATVGIVTAIGSALLLPPLQARSVFGDGIASALYVGNYWFALHNVDYLAPVMPESPFQHYWSLGVEEQFYLVWPPMIIATAWLIRRMRRRKGTHAAPPKRPYLPFLIVLSLVAAGSFAMSLVITYVLPAVAFFSLPTRAWQLAVGGLVALTASQWGRLSATPAAIAGWTGLALILLSCTLFSANTPFPGTAALMPVLGAALVIGGGCAAPSRGCGRVLAVSPMQAIGRVSYSWYLWHWPVLLFAPLLLGQPLGLPGRLAAAAVSAVLAVLTLHLIENPLRFAAPVRRSPAVSLALGGAATAAAALVCVVLLVWVPVPIGHGAPRAPLTITAAPTPTGADTDAYTAAVQHSFAQVQSALAAATHQKAVPSNLNPPLSDVAAQLNAIFLNGCMRNALQAGQPQCATGDTASSTTVALVGDSNAAMWNPAFQQVAEQRRWRLVTMAKAVCPMLDLPFANPLFRLATRCEQWRAQIMDRMHAERPRLVVLSVYRGYRAGNRFQPGFTSYSPAWLDSLTRLVRQLRDTGADVLVLGPIPDPPSDVPICVSAHLDDAMACSEPRSAVVNPAGITAESAATEAGGGQYVDLTQLFCTPDRCLVIVGNTLVYFDSNHVTSEYSRQLAPAIEAIADRALAQR
ncbi:acyltransferase [Mycolicibacterium novocastrense]|uniref:Acyltransferase n=1 Tax=Mycolicibacterium novocastrense TaxID=59813 RepID=A0AAW5SKI0_MYCNV|nr:acyltransferase family protein [Mycolicibacterium novocastrense]MCV7023724.1 acyltransferase [Mycolicibacterium novocastrense]GAT11599.1 peptidoglycan O-acetyl transferase yrhL [Mycolicibacterium novocastrense]